MNKWTFTFCIRVFGPLADLGPAIHDRQGDNRLTSSETGALTFWTYDIANRLVTSVSGGLTTTYTFDRNGNKTIVRESVNIYSMGYDNMNRLNYQIDGSNRFTYTYDASSLKRYEDAPTGRTTIMWDGSNYLGGKS